MNKTIKAEELYTVNEETGFRAKFYGNTAGCGTMEGLTRKMIGFIRFPFGSALEDEIDKASYVGFRLHRKDSVHGKSTPVDGALRGEWSHWVELDKAAFKGAIRINLENGYAIYDDAELLVITGAEKEEEAGLSIDVSANSVVSTLKDGGNISEISRTPEGCTVGFNTDVSDVPYVSKVYMSKEGVTSVTKEGVTVGIISDDINTAMAFKKPFDIRLARLEVAEMLYKKIMSGKYDYDDLALFIELMKANEYN